VLFLDGRSIMRLRVDVCARKMVTEVTTPAAPSACSNRDSYRKENRKTAVPGG
jgi:hypothetical protein